MNKHLRITVITLHFTPHSHNSTFISSECFIGGAISLAPPSHRTSIGLNFHRPYSHRSLPSHPFRRPCSHHSRSNPNVRFSSISPLVLALLRVLLRFSFDLASAVQARAGIREHRSSKGAPEQILNFCNCKEDVRRKAMQLLLSLLSLLRHGEVGLGFVLCATEEKANECFSAAKYIMEISESKLAKQCSSPDNEHSNVSIGLLLGTPSEIIQYIEEGSVVPAEIRYMVLDDLDFMLGSGLGSNIHKILEPLQDHESTSSYKRFQTVLVTSSITEVLGDESPIVKHLERDHAENIYVIDIGLVI
ncbi:DEAD-box ATP-dependent RNA helicase [Arachis hypogaea]|nr:DEAD-box ATP-dependent RNA helicase [Arachis hypogaea]